MTKAEAMAREVLEIHADELGGEDGFVRELSKALTQMRIETLEDAAKACEDVHDTYNQEDLGRSYTGRMVSLGCAAVIRRLKGKE